MGKDEQKEQASNKPDASSNYRLDDTFARIETEVASQESLSAEALVKLSAAARRRREREERQREARGANGLTEGSADGQQHDQQQLGAKIQGVVAAVSNTSCVECAPPAAGVVSPRFEKGPKNVELIDALIKAQESSNTARVPAQSSSELNEEHSSGATAARGVSVPVSNDDTSFSTTAAQQGQQSTAASRPRETLIAPGAFAMPGRSYRPPPLAGTGAEPPRTDISKALLNTQLKTAGNNFGNIINNGERDLEAAAIVEPSRNFSFLTTADDLVMGTTFMPSQLETTSEDHESGHSGSRMSSEEQSGMTPSDLSQQRSNPPSSTRSHPNTAASSLTDSPGTAEPLSSDVAAVAEKVDAEAVVYASNVVKERPKWLYWTLAFLVVAIIVGLSMGLMMSGNGSDSGNDMGEQRDPRCVKPTAEQDILDICHCTGNASGLVLAENEEVLYGVLGGLYLGAGLVNQTYPRDSCSIEHKAILSIANFERYGLNLDGGINFITSDPDSFTQPNAGLIITYGIAVVMQQFIVKLLYLSTGGEHWDRQDNWMVTGLVCDFEGVSCGLMERVQFIQLPANNLNGTIPSQVAKLPFLRTLDLSSNPNLVGTLPSELGQMKSLHELELSSCGLTGSLPSELGDIAALDRIIMSNNTLSGSIPPEFGALKRMREINLDDNRLTGSLPSSMFQMTNLEILGLKNNTLNGTMPEEIG